MKKSMLRILFVVLLVSVPLMGCGNHTSDSATPSSSTDGREKIKVGMVTDAGSVNDKSFNQLAWESLQKLQDKLGYEVKYIEPKGDAEIIPSLNQFVKGNYDLTWATSGRLDAAVTNVAAENPTAKLGIIDVEVKAPNVASVLFKDQEGAFLVGVIAGSMSKSNKIGFVGGMDIPVVKRIEAGFREGIAAVNPEAAFKPVYAGEFVRVDKGKSAAATLYNEGVDIIFHAAGLTGNGVFSEAKERVGRGERVWVIGVDEDQSLEFGDDITLTSMIKKVDEAIYQISKDLAAGKFPSNQTTHMGLKENAVDIAPTSTKNVPQPVLDKVKHYRQQIIEGRIQIPTT